MTVGGESCLSQEVEMEGGFINWPMPTLGGKQFWTDHRWVAGWRLQHNALTNHWRVVDASNVRRAWGSREACLEKIDEHQARQSADATPAAVVVLLHGLMRSTGSMDPLAKAFSQRGDFQPISFAYASTQASIDDHAAALREWVEHLPGRPEMSFVGHSLGNIVLRRTIALWQREGDPEQVLPRMHRVVMLGPPNQGSSIARQLARLGLFEKITGTSGKELGVVWSDFQSSLASPACPFYIVAGDLSESSLKNPLIVGQNDFVVTVDETKLDGAAEHIVVPVLHSFLMSDSRVIESTLKFIEPLPPKPE